MYGSSPSITKQPSATKHHSWYCPALGRVSVSRLEFHGGTPKGTRNGFDFNGLSVPPSIGSWLVSQGFMAGLAAIQFQMIPRAWKLSYPQLIQLVSCEDFDFPGRLDLNLKLLQQYLMLDGFWEAPPLVGKALNHCNGVDSLTRSRGIRFFLMDCRYRPRVLRANHLE